MAALTDHTAPAANGEAPPADHLRRRIWNLALAAGLQVFHRQSLGGAERGPVEELVAASLVAMPASTDLANELCAHLADRPYLGAAHEDAVLELVAASGAGEFPVEVATTLLSTLWRNMQSTGQRTSEELTGLALLLLQDGNATERASAAQLLLVDPRYRLVLLEHLRSSGDRNLAREVAMVAARVLEPATALEMLTATASMTADFVAPYLTLGHRDPELLQRQYELQLANGTSPGLRGELVRGVGFTKDPRGLATAPLAFGSDPDPDVRLKALFVLTANAADALGEQSVSAALRDPAIRDNPSRLATVVLVLENLASAGLVNAVDRLGQQLLACGSLTDYSQRSLRELLAARERRLATRQPIVALRPFVTVALEAGPLEQRPDVGGEIDLAFGGPRQFRFLRDCAHAA